MNLHASQMGSSGYSLFVQNFLQTATNGTLAGSVQHGGGFGGGGQVGPPLRMPALLCAMCGAVQQSTPMAVVLSPRQSQSHFFGACDEWPGAVS
jgi:hypothetical protein